MNISQAEKRVCAFHAVFRVDVSGVKPLQNPTGRSPFDHFLGPQSMQRLFKTDSNFAFIDPVSAVYRGSGWLRAYQNDYIIDNYLEPAVI